MKSISTPKLFKTSLFILISFIPLINNIFGQCGTLPTSMPQNQIDLSSANLAIACTFAPTIFQMTDNAQANSVNGVADLILDIYYDGDENTTNNWDNLDNYDINDPALNPRIYYSVIWFTGHWVVTYAIYHARDYAGQGICCPDNHENDMEGVVYVIDRSTNTRIFGGAISHSDLLTHCNPSNSVSIDDGTHANRLGALPYYLCISTPLNPCDVCKFFINPHITYTPGTTASQTLSRSGSNISGTSTYVLVDIFSSNSNSLWSKKLASGDDVIWGDIFAHAAPFSNTNCQDQGIANPPWGWHDQFDHSNDATINLMTKAGFCSNFNTTLLYNPYTNQPLPECGYPLSLTVTNINDFGANLDWDDVAGASFYRIYFKKSSESQWIESTSSQSNFVLNNLDPNTQYDIRIASNCNMRSIASSFTTTCIICSCIKIDIIINEDQILNTNSISGDIIIKTGKTLTIDNSVNFNRNSSIIVEHGARLILNGATLTSCHPNFKWKGIKLYGNPFVVQGFPGNPNFSPGGVVEVKNNSLIEYAEIGINTSNLVSGGIFGTYDWSGGLVTVSNSSFRNCDIGVNFGPYGFNSEYYNLEDQSSFNFVSFDACNICVNLTSNLGVQFDNCTMTTFGNGIVSIGSKINFDNNSSINEATFGISFLNTWPNILGSEIKSSNFNNFNDIYWESTGNLSPYMLEYNTFSGIGGVFGYGLSEFFINNNTYNFNTEGISTWETGEGNGNIISNNSFNYNQYGSSVYGLNNHEYNDNCFAYSSVSDIELVGSNTSIYNNQGDEFNAANNCFYGNAYNILTETETSKFEYFIKKYTTNQDCKYPGNTGNFDVNDEFDSNQEIFDCGNNFSPPLTPRNRWCIIPDSISTMLQMENLLKQEILTIQNNNTYTLIQKRRMIALKNRCLNTLTNIIIQSKMKQEGRESAISYASSRSLFKYKIIAYSFIAETGDYVRARNYLNSIETENEQETDFKTGQDIYLDYLQDRKNYVLSISDKNTLFSIANKSNELSGFARSIYYVLTGNFIKINTRHIDLLTPRENIDSKSLVQTKISSFPNPLSNGIYTISIEDGNHDVDYQIEVRDISGKTILQTNVSNGNKDIDLPFSGIYFVFIFENGKCIFKNKIVKL